MQVEFLIMKNFINGVKMENKTLEGFLNFCQYKNKFSQLDQDLLALYLFDKPGFFVEFGATDGVSLSNTKLLESSYGWNGILCEPSKFYQEDLIRNRSSRIDFRCVSDVTGQRVEFSQCDVPELSSMSSHIDSDHWYETRKNNQTYDVETVSLDDLLLQNNAPKTIEYISIDTEGSEYTILNNFSFDWDVKLFTIEHNYAKNRDNIFAIMVKNGYRQIFSEVSQWDDWYYRD